MLGGILTLARGADTAGQVKRDSGAQSGGNAAPENAAPRGPNKVLRVTLLALMLLAALCLLLFELPRVQRFDISGNSVTSGEEIIAASGVEIGQHIFETNIDAVKVNLKKNPRFRNVEVKFRLPSTLAIQVDESEPVARLTKLEADVVIDRNGLVIFAGNAENKQDIPQVLGMSFSGYQTGEPLAATDDYQLWVLRQILGTLYDNGYAPDYALIDLSNSVDIKMMSRQRVTVHFGQLDKLKDKLKRAGDVLAALDAEGQTGGVLDVSTAQTAYNMNGGTEILVPAEWSAWLPPDDSLPPQTTGESMLASEPTPAYEISSDIPVADDEPTIEVIPGEVVPASPTPGDAPAKTAKPKTKPKPKDDPAALGFDIPDELAP